MRLFIAIELPETVRARLGETLEHLRRYSPDSKWVKPEKTHLTLAFLGHLDPSLRPEIEGALTGVTARHRPFEVTYGGGGSFGGKARPRVLFVNVGGALEQLSALQADLAREMTALGIHQEDRVYSPHLTLARARHPRGDAGLAACTSALADVNAGNDRVREVVLFQSRTSPRGAEYEALFRAPLMA